MTHKVCTGLLVLNLIFISSIYCKSLDNRTSSSPSTTTTRIPISTLSSTLKPTTQISDQISNWSILVKELKVKKEEGEEIVRLAPVLPLAYKIHKFQLENTQLLESNSQLKKQFSELKNDIPEGVRSLIWGSKCAIRNGFDSDLYLNIVRPSGSSQSGKLERGNGTKTYWKFLTFLENQSPSEEKLAFLIQDSGNSNNLLGIKYVDEPAAGGWGDDGGNLEIIQARQNGPGKMVKWTLEPFISAGGPSKGEVVNWMSTEHRHPDKSSTLYLHGSLKAASFFRLVDGSAWVFECVA